MNRRVIEGTSSHAASALVDRSGSAAIREIPRTSHCAAMGRTKVAWRCQARMQVSVRVGTLAPGSSADGLAVKGCRRREPGAFEGLQEIGFLTREMLTQRERLRTDRRPASRARHPTSAERDQYLGGPWLPVGWVAAGTSPDPTCGVTGRTSCSHVQGRERVKRIASDIWRQGGRGQSWRRAPRLALRVVAMRQTGAHPPSPPS